MFGNPAEGGGTYPWSIGERLHAENTSCLGDKGARNGEGSGSVELLSFELRQVFSSFFNWMRACSTVGDSDFSSVLSVVWVADTSVDGWESGKSMKLEDSGRLLAEKDRFHFLKGEALNGARKFTTLGWKERLTGEPSWLGSGVKTFSPLNCLMYLLSASWMKWYCWTVWTNPPL